MAAAIQMYLAVESAQIVAGEGQPPSNWLRAARLEAQGIGVTPRTMRGGWRL